ncbi:hypothetical protein Landi51_10234 [Colletotrichum acutatum]
MTPKRAQMLRGLGYGEDYAQWRVGVGVGKPGELVFGLRFVWKQRKRRSVVAKPYLCSGLGSGGDKVQVPGGQNWRQSDSSTAGLAERKRSADATPGAHSLPIGADGPGSCLDKADLQLSFNPLSDDTLAINMADNPDEPSQNALASTFPNPPPFWRDFTPENVARIEELRKAQAEKDGVTVKDLPARIPDVPESLINLQPPAEPLAGTWKVLGGNYTLDDKLPSLEEGEIKRLVPAHSEEKDGKHLDRAFELKKMAKSLLLNFLELVAVMATVPDDVSERPPFPLPPKPNQSQAATKIEDLRTLFINFHHVLNEYRPHQARESAIALMQSNLDRTRAETAAIRAQVDKAKRVLEGLGSLDTPKVPDVVSPVVDGELTSKEAEAFAKTREQEVWGEADALFL